MLTADQEQIRSKLSKASSELPNRKESPEKLWARAGHPPSWTLQTAIDSLLVDFSHITGMSSSTIEAVKELQRVWEQGVDAVFELEKQLNSAYARACIAVQEALSNVYRALDEEPEE